MATSTTAIAKAYSGTLTDFKSWSKPVSDALNSFGWNRVYSYAGASVRTGGVAGTFTQSTWTEVTSVPTTNGDTQTTSVTEVWGMNDSNNTTCPFYMRIDYYYDGGNRFRFQFGQSYSSSDGTVSGRGTAVGINDFQPYCTVDGSNSANYHHFFSGSTNGVSAATITRFSMGLFVDKTADGIYLAIERAKTSTGADTTTYVAVTILGGNAFNNCYFVLIPASPTAGYKDQRLPVVQTQFSSGTTTATFGSNIVMFPVLPVFNQVNPPMLSTAIVKSADYSTNMSTNSITVYGSSHTFIGFTSSLFSRGMFEENDCRVLMLYE